MKNEVSFYISLLVHEKPEVVLDQLRNFRRHAPRAVIVLHLSRGFALPDTVKRETEALGNIHCNPVQVATNKINLLYPHLINVDYILGLQPPDEAKVAFHASNDLFVRGGVDEYVAGRDAAYFSRGFVHPETTDPYAQKIFLDADFAALRERTGARTLIWSQIEGSFYPIGILRRIVDQIREASFEMEQKRPYFGEEVILPTLAHPWLVGARVGTPYVLSEVSFLVKYVELRRRYFGDTIVAKVFGRLLKIMGPHKITRGLVDRIRRHDLGFYERFGSASGNVRFCGDTTFAVKRVERDMNSVLRKYIGGLSA